MRRSIELVKIALRFARGSHVRRMAVDSLLEKLTEQEAEAILAAIECAREEGKIEGERQGRRRFGLP